MKIMISYPPLESEKGVPLLAQNRQFQWFNKPTYIYPMIPAAAATLLSKHGYQVIWDDAIAGEKSYQEWWGNLLRERPDLIALETKTPVVKRHWQIINQIKSQPDKSWQPRVVLMGDHVTALPEESLQQSQADFVLTGGDYDVLLLGLADYLSKSPTPLPPGIWYRENGRIVNTGKFQLTQDLNRLPFIDRDLTRWHLYSEKNGNFKYLPGSYIMAGRDCWYHRCKFCSWTTLFPKFRTRSPQHVLDEIGQLIEKYQIREIMDDSGTFPTGEWLTEFCRGMIQRGYNRRVRLDCNMRFGAASEEDYRLMQRAGFRWILFGLESANQSTLDKINKGIKAEQIPESCRQASGAGLFPHVTIMFGYPWEDYAQLMNTVNLGRYLLKKGYAYTLQATMVIPYPGTPLFEECRINGWLKTTDWDRFDMREPVMVTPMSPAQVKQAVQQVYSIAFNPEFILRKIMSIRDIQDLRYFSKAAKSVWGHLKDFRHSD